MAVKCSLVIVHSSAGGHSMSQDEPPGWRTLQEKAQRETDPKKLAEIIDEMNRLLTEHEKATEGRRKNPASNTRHRSAGK